VAGEVFEGNSQFTAVVDSNRLTKGAGSFKVAMNECVVRNESELRSNHVVNQNALNRCSVVTTLICSNPGANNGECAVSYFDNVGWLVVTSVT
jgi:hypothetical protein